MKTIAMILAGGEGTRLTTLSEDRAKPAVPFAGKFRIIDFTLSNCVNSGIYTIGVLTQYRPHSLNEHISIGKPWDLDRGRGGIRLMQPYQQRGGQHWYAGTADAIYQNISYIEEQSADAVVILSGDHIYKMDYRPMLRHHQEKGADLTIAVMPVPLEETDRFGIMQVDEEDRIVEFHEKPKNRDKGNLASMGIYVFNTDILKERLHDGTDSRVDFGKDVIPAMLEASDRLYAYQFDDYWVDVGTIDSFWDTNLALLQPEPDLDLYTENWPIHTRSEERPAAKIGPQAKIVSSMVSNGCIVRGLVVNSLKAIVDKDVVIGAGAVVGAGDETVANLLLPDKLTNGISVIGKGAHIPDSMSVGRNVLINSRATVDDFPADGVVADGETV